MDDLPQPPSPQIVIEMGTGGWEFDGDDILGVYLVKAKGFKNLEAGTTGHDSKAPLIFSVV